jgi:hypothetical protein
MALLVSLFDISYVLKIVSLNNRITNGHRFISDYHEDGCFEQVGSLLEVTSYVTTVSVATTLCNSPLSWRPIITRNYSIQTIRYKIYIREDCPVLTFERYLKPFLLCVQDAAICVFPGNLVKFDMTAELRKSDN